MYCVRPGSIVYTDCWKRYREEDLLKLGCTHVKVNHEEYFEDPITGCCTNIIEGTWNCIKLRVPSTLLTCMSDNADIGVARNKLI
jgi:hypothetical protein